jgi:hypothetical protein
MGEIALQVALLARIKTKKDTQFHSDRSSENEIQQFLVGLVHALKPSS